MEKSDLKEYESKIKRLVTSNEYDGVYELKNGDFLKVFNPRLLRILVKKGFNLENKILDAKKIDEVPEIIIPKTSIYNGNQFVGYISPKAKHRSLIEMYKEFTPEQRTDLHLFAKIINTLEDALKRANKNNIVMPDLLTPGNVFMNEKFDAVEFGDYDSLQIGNHKTIHFCNDLGNESDFHTKKYINDNYLFNSNIDKKSIINFYYLAALNIDLNKVNEYAINNNDNIIKVLVESTGIENEDLLYKTYLSLQKNGPDNEYLGNTVNKIAEEYKLEYYKIDDRKSVKRLIKK